MYCEDVNIFFVLRLKALYCLSESFLNKLLISGTSPYIYFLNPTTLLFDIPAGAIPKAAATICPISLVRKILTNKTFLAKLLVKQIFCNIFSLKISCQKLGNMFKYLTGISLILHRKIAI